MFRQSESERRKKKSNKKSYCMKSNVRKQDGTEWHYNTASLPVSVVTTNYLLLVIFLAL
jgi:hypothetical protein